MCEGKQLRRLLEPGHELNNKRATSKKTKSQTRVRWCQTRANQKCSVCSHTPAALPASWLMMRMPDERDESAAVVVVRTPTLGVHVVVAHSQAHPYLHGRDPFHGRHEAADCADAGGCGFAVQTWGPVRIGGGGGGGGRGGSVGQRDEIIKPERKEEGKEVRKKERKSVRNTPGK